MAVEFINEETEEFFNHENFLYRIITLDRFIDFQKDKLVFVSPSRWSDPYEKAFLEAKYQFNGNEYYHPLKTTEGNKLFAQCWTASKQTEAMWRGFAPNNDGVMIKISANNLINILEEVSSRGSYDFHIGKVNYENSQVLYDMKAQVEVWQDIENNEVNDRTLSLLLKKRNAFNFENEFRILAINRHETINRSYVSFNFQSILNHVEFLKFDPRMGRQLYGFIKDKIQDQYPDLNIHKSNLYANPVKTLVFGGNPPPELNDEIVLN